MFRNDFCALRYVHSFLILFLIGINFGKEFPELFDYYSKNQDQLEGLYERFPRGNDFTPWLLITESQH